MTLGNRKKHPKGSVKIGIDLGATRIKMGLVDKRGRVSHRRQINTPVNAKKKNVIDSLVENIDGIISEAGIARKNVAGIGMGVPGPTDFKKGIVRYFPNIKGWENTPLKSILEKRLGLKVNIDNDVNAMTLGEYVFGAGRGAGNVVCLTLGTGVGGGLILNGGIYRGSTMAAGEIGHIPINESGPRCNCRGMACIESYIGNRYILNRIKKIFGRAITLEELTRLAKKGNKAAKRIWEDVGTKLGIALTGVVNLLNPDIVVVGGGVSNAGELILGPARLELKKRAMKDQAEHVKLVRARLGEDAGIIGASLLVN
ncbi:MAG: ROK family protein [Candidatus Omnitrophica bacterium]|nr:ROK family protein [Candidatus Omnitrophota bacterium]